MTPEDFIRKHITAALMAEGFPESVAGGGALNMAVTTTAACHRRARRGQLLTTASTAPECGRKGRVARLNVKRARKSRDELPLSPAYFDLLES